VQGGQTMGETISLQDILEIIKERLLLIISLTIVAVGIAAVLNFYVLTPIYLAQTQVLVNQKSEGEQIYSWNQIEADIQLINTYNDVITSPIILNDVVEELQLNISPEQLSSQIRLSNESDSKVLYIEVKDTDPVLAVNIANTTVEVFKEKIPSLMNTDNINILSTAKLSENPTPVSPNKKLNLATGALIGIVLGIGLAFVLELLNTTIKNEKDVEEILSTPIMGIVGSIPLEKEKKSSFKSHRVRGSQGVWVEK
jgi:capsular polysaccharide biosynthesis protein